MKQPVAAIVISVCIVTAILVGSVRAKTERKKIILYPAVGCSKSKCAPDQPCCNACYMHGWQTPDRMHAVVAVSGELPFFPADGCGQVEKFLEAEGVLEPGTFRVHTWKVIDGGRIFPVTGPCILLRYSAYASGCSRPAAEIKADVSDNVIRVDVIIPPTGECEAAWKVDLEKKFCGLSLGEYVFTGADVRMENIKQVQ